VRTEHQTGMTLGALQRAVAGSRLLGSAELRVGGVQHDSRRVVEGDLFVAVPGAAHDGFDFVDGALQRGAVALMAEREAPFQVPQLIVADARGALGRAAELVYGSPTAKLSTIGITGTNGKTTTGYLLCEAIEAASGRPAFVGTTGLSFAGEHSGSAHTTPEGDDVSRFARRALDAGATHLVMEVSSHGLALGRVDALSFEVAAFTNLSQDHLDYHGSLEHYGNSKARLFTELEPKHVVIHIDDPFGAELAARLGRPALRCTRRDDVDAEIVATGVSTTREGISASVSTPAGRLQLRSPMLGEHNLENMLVALGCAYALGLDLEAVARRWSATRGTPGRLERIAHPGDVAVLVDYAHTPDALARALDTVRSFTPGRLIVLFGAGGDRDRGKRPLMTQAAVDRAELIVLTSDNPRTEDPLAILEELARAARDAGVPRLEPEALGKASSGYCVLQDRRAAIAAAIAAARPGDSVLLAGKGHEEYQLIGTQKLPFDDRKEARVAIEALGGEV
jgi:UDP-N-acetylmuramoyl-L-alanyl-D-glutamate--2,6-diaminopimelate ligase